MKNFLLSVFMFSFLLSCNDKKPENNKEINYPSHNYNDAKPDTAKLVYNETVYVPVYSDIYHHDGTKRFLLTSTVSVRNISLRDSTYVLNAVYNDSYGRLLRTFATSPILLKPFESIEFVIEDAEDKGGAGASFIIEWGGNEKSAKMLIQSVMIGTESQQGISFMTNGVVISSKEKK